MPSDLEQCHDDLAAAQQEVEQLEQAIESRAPIEQAKGILMTLLEDCDADQAFDLLVRTSQRTHVKLAQIATELCESVGEHNTLPEEFVAAFRGIRGES